jgi:glutamate synthase domain-containing protein 2/glutamate synthase domain-containing protein 1/glutamate synthase domain-containing protein 3
MRNINVPLFNPDEFHDACGTGFIAEISGQPSRRIVTLAIRALKQLVHRGAKSADTKTGDGAGILTDIPQDFFKQIIEEKFQYSWSEKEALAIAMVFTTPAARARVDQAFRAFTVKLGMSYIGAREVPANPDALGEAAKASCPLIIQYFIAAPTDSKRRVEAELYLLRRAIENELAKEKSPTFICSLSSKTIVYKGLMTSTQIDHFYVDLIDPHYVAKVALFHERFSTNTNPNWFMAQPFRLLAHNGEINTLKGNRLWMQSRETELQSDFWGEDLETLRPIVENHGSDSFSLDNVLEFLAHSGRGLFHSLMMLIPEPYANNKNISQALKDFYIYHENYIEPWDGPAALVYTDGDFVGAKLDRNGLRPLRYTITKDGLVIMASEAGVVEVDEDNLVVHHHMTSGEIFAIALDGSGILDDEQIKKKISEAAPYSQLISNNFKILSRGSEWEEFGEFRLPEDGFDKRLRLALGWSEEDLTRFLIPMAETGGEPVGSMGDDTPVAVLSNQHRRLYDYFKQSFAQVTNPPIDPIRESFVTTLFKYLGSEENLLSPIPRFNGAIRIESPVLSPREQRLLTENHHWFPHAKLFCHLPAPPRPRSDLMTRGGVGSAFEARLEALVCESERLVNDGCKIIFLSDENLQAHLLPIPMPLIVSAIHHHLSRQRIRSKVSLICLTGDVVEDHHVACLIAMGASAVYPYMAYELIREHYAEGEWPKRMSNYRASLEKGLLKIMSKMGISTVTSYHGSMLFHGLGLSRELLQKYFPSIKCAIGGIGLAQIHRQLVERNAHAFGQQNPSLDMKGFFQFRKNGEAHGFAPSEFRQIHKAAAGENSQPAPKETLVYLRDLLDYKKTHAVPPEQVEELEEIVKRFGSGGVSFGAISDEAHRVIARGMHQLNGRSNTGEGGEPFDRFAPGNPDKSVNSYIKQIASARFGVTVDYLAAAREIQIKIAQGAKPGEGGQLPGHKVSVKIASARAATPGVPLISPPPHHDIYSIEDIAQLIYDLKQVNPRAKVSVKLVAQPGVGTVASGVVKAGADVVLISGGDGGTGASPLGSIKHAGLPWELGLPETHQALTANGLRSRVTLRVDGGIKEARDVIIAALLGAEEFDFGTSVLVAIGCVMARQCHLNTCPAGIATQDEEFQKKFKGAPQHVVNYLTHVAKEVRQQLSEMGFYNLGDIVGRTDLLFVKKELQKQVAEKGIDFSAILNPAAVDGLPLESQVKYKPTVVRAKPHLDELVIEESRQAIMTHGQALVNKTIRNTDRTIGTRLSGELAFLYGRGNFKGSIQYRLTGTAGQSFGAFLIDGVELRLRGIANDYVGKGMSGGLITVRLPKEIRARKKTHTIIGNVALYGATGGTLLVAGRAGERFAVRNSGASAVVEGVGNHGCEYMTRGTVVVLGDIGQNFGAGMTGGVAYIYRFTENGLDNLNTAFVRAAELSLADEGLVHHLLRQHHFHTGSVLGEHILENWEEERKRFVKTMPTALDAIDFRRVYEQQKALRAEGILSE